VRRTVNLLSLIGALAGMAAIAVEGHAQDRKPIVGLPWPGPPGTHNGLAAFSQGLTARGYQPARSVMIIEAYAGGDPERLPETMTELLGRRVDILVTPGGLATRAAQRATSTVPIVSITGDPVGLGFARSLSHPGGNITGVSSQASEFSVKWLEMLLAAVPKAKRVAALLNGDNSITESELANLQRAARALDIELRAVLTRRGALDASLEEIEVAKPDGIVVGDDPYLDSQGPRIASFARDHRIAAFFGGNVRGEALLSYSMNFDAAWRKAADFVDRILKGARPADLPIEQATDYVLYVNLRTARALAIIIPASLLARADEVIE